MLSLFVMDWRDWCMTGIDDEEDTPHSVSPIRSGTKADGCHRVMTPRSRPLGTTGAPDRRNARRLTRTGCQNLVPKSLSQANVSDIEQVLIRRSQCCHSCSLHEMIQFIADSLLQIAREYTTKLSRNGRQTPLKTRCALAALRNEGMHVKRGVVIRSWLI